MERRFRIDGFDQPLEVTWILKATAGTLVGSGSTPAVRGITTDSRLVQKGDLFIAIRGQNVDGHGHVTAAVAAGAAVVLCAKDAVSDVKTKLNATCSAIAVDDTLYALGELARTWRKNFNIPILGVTGSNGKTTTKEISVAILEKSGTPLATWKNWNNLMGLPLTLMGLRHHHSHAVIEMGMNSFGEIRRLAEIANPSHRLITNIMPVHLEGVGDLAGVARAKGELLEQIDDKQTFIVNNDDPHLRKLAEKVRANKVTYSQRPDSGSDVRLGSFANLGQKGFSGDLCLPGGKRLSFLLPLSGEHNLSNMLAAAAATWSMGAKPEDIVAALRGARSAEMRSEWLQLDDDIQVYNDCYNANPGSMRAALDTVAKCPAKRRIAVLGDMWELGASAAEAHEEILRHAKQIGFDLIFTSGDNFRNAGRRLQSEGGASGWIRSYTSAEPLSQELGTLVRKGDVVIVKGSRAMQMERAVQHLQNRFGKGEV